MNSETTYLHLAATGGETSSEYECVFNEDILIKKDSKIALQSVSLNFNPNQIYVDSTNNYFFLATAPGIPGGFGIVNALTGDATSIRGQLTNGQYNATTLMPELTYQLNKTNTYYIPVDTAGKAEFSAILTNNKVNIQLARTSDDLKPAATDYAVNSITINSGGVQNAFARAVGATAGDYSYAIYNPFWIRSRGSYRMRLPVNTIGTIVGLVENIPDAATVSSLPMNNYYLAIQNTDGKYTTRFNGANQDIPAIVPANDDIIIILIGQGNYRIDIEKAGNPVTVFEQAYTKTTNKRYLHGALSILDPLGTADRFRFTPSGFQLATVDGVHEIADISELTNPNYISRIGANPSGRQPTITLSLSDGLRNLLGYNINTFVSVKNPDSFSSIKNLDLISFPNAILVELVNVPLNAYDAVSRRRKNILGFLPGFEQTADTSNYYYIASEMVFINTKLFSDTLINSWRVRITNGDGGVISVDPGKMSINIVVTSK